MRRFVYRRLLIVSALIGIIAIVWEVDNYEVSNKNLHNIEVIPGGMPLGIYMETDGILVLETERIEDVNGKLVEPAKNIVKTGDYILEINHEEIEGKNELISQVANLESSNVTMKIRRDDQCLEVEFDAVEVEEDSYKLGIWIRDSVQGLGTITFLTKDNKFGALGHGIHDADTEDLLEIKDGRIYDINIVGIQKGKRGEPGGVEGIIVYNHRNILGTIEENTECGVYGTVEKVDALFENNETMEICEKKDIELGDAVIRCGIGGNVEEYDIKIKSVDYFTRNENKGIVIEIVDEKLLEMTGGIVQGMSGSPVIQNGRIVGAVTHVLVNDPTRGYGIFIENMLEAAK